MLEGLALAAFRFIRPLTVVARKYSDSDRANVDIYLPHWLAKYNKQIYTAILVVFIIITVVRLIP